jgi:hypothetical protein
LQGKDIKAVQPKVARIPMPTAVDRAQHATAICTRQNHTTMLDPGVRRNGDNRRVRFVHPPCLPVLTLLEAIGNAMRQATDQHAIMDGTGAVEIFLGLGHLLQPALSDLIETIWPSSP